VSGYPEGTIAIIQQPVPTVSFFQESYKFNLSITIPAGGEVDTTVPVEENKVLFIYDVYISSSLSSLLKAEIWLRNTRHLGSIGYGKVEMHFKGGIDYYENVTLKVYNENTSEDADVLIHLNGITMPSKFTYKWRQIQKQRLYP